MCCLPRPGLFESNMKEWDYGSGGQSLSSLCPQSVQTNSELYRLGDVCHHVIKAVCLPQEVDIFLNSSTATQLRPRVRAALLNESEWYTFFLYMNIRLTCGTMLQLCQQIGPIILEGSGQKQDKSICFSIMLHPLAEGERTGWGRWWGGAEEGKDKWKNLKGLRTKKEQTDTLAESCDAIVKLRYFLVQQQPQQQRARLNSSYVLNKGKEEIK